jgi:biopolymer transport protein TolR
MQMMNSRRGGESTGGQYTPPPALCEINVTPMVDVMLVLLIIFMVSAPLMQQGVQVDLPKTDSQPLAEQEESIVLIVKKNGQIEINQNVIPIDGLAKKLAAIYKDKKRKEIFIQADQAIPYGTVATVMSTVQRAGISKIGLVTEPKPDRKR